ncbi:LINE-1 reverse transcriptase like, partial [Trifolium medium]|nr:LINE-1 reverse transcriptase like [Trifolium medium]
IEELVVEIRDLDTRGEEEGLSNQEVESRKEKFPALWKLLKNKEALISKWLKEGDANTKFFHGSVKTRSKKNLISALRSGDVWLDSPNLIKAAVFSYFVNHVSSTPRVRPKANGVVFPRLSEVENVGLVSPFSLEEIEDVVKNSDGNKCSGPDGFNYAFLKKFWELLKGDIQIMFDQFHGNSCLPKSLLSYFVTLVPKVNSPSDISDFRPISLLGCLYKLIAKLLAKRLAKVIDSVIAPNQSAFIKDRNLVDGVLVVNEVVELAKKTKRECLIFKVNFEKAYDSVDWGFLEYMLQRCGFCEKWIEWIHVCFCGEFIGACK